MVEFDGNGWLQTVLTARRARLRSALDAPLVVRRSWYVFHKLVAPPAPGNIDGVFACRELTGKDEHLRDAFDRPRWRSEVAAWLDDPDVSLFVAFYAGQPVAYESISIRLPKERPFRALALADNEVWVRDTYALPGYRARGVIRALHAKRNATMAALGLCGTVTAVPVDRPALLAATYDALTWKVESLDYRRVLVFGRTHIEPDVLERLEHRLLVNRQRRRAELPEFESLPAAA